MDATTSWWIVALVWQDFFSGVVGERNRGEQRTREGERERERGVPLVGRAAIPSLFRERVRGPPNQFQLESGIFAGQAQRSSWKGLLAVLSYYRGRSPESRASLAVNQAPAHTESTVRRDPCALWLIVRVGEYQEYLFHVCVDLSVEGRRTGEKAGLKGEGGEMMEDGERKREREREGSNR